MDTKNQRLVNSRRTPINDEYESCESVVVKLMIYSGDLEPSQVTSSLWLSPSSSQTKGETRISKYGHSRTVNLNAWFLSSEGKVDSKDLRSHLNWLLDKIESKKKALHDLQSTEGVTMTVNCVWWSACGHGGPTLWPEQMSRLADLNLECTFDIYFGEE